MAATSSDARRSGNENEGSLALTGGFPASESDSTLIAINARPRFSQDACTRSNAFSCSIQSGDFLVPNASNAGLPRKVANECKWPPESGSVKSGADTGASNHVATFVGSCSAAANSRPDGEGAGDSPVAFSNFRNGSVRILAEPSSTQILWLAGRSCSSWLRPLGHRIDARGTLLPLPSPKSISLVC